MFTSLTKYLIKSNRITPLLTRPFSIIKSGNPQQLNLGSHANFKVAFFSAQSYDQHFFNIANEQYGFKLDYYHFNLNALNAKACHGADAVCAFVHDTLDAQTLQTLQAHGVKTIAMRCCGFNNVDIEAAKSLGLEVTTVPAYSPEAVAEHTIALLMALNRRIHKAFNRIREGNFSLEGLLGMNISGKTAGIIGVGRVGLATAKILNGFGCHVLGYDPINSEEFKKYGKSVSLKELLSQSDIVTLHCPLMPETYHMINKDTLALMKKGVFLINTSRGAVIDTAAVINELKTRKIGGLAIDVYEQENELFFKDCSSDIIQDDLLQLLITFPNVLITGHQGFFTKEALTQIAEVTLANLACFADGVPCENALVRSSVKTESTERKTKHYGKQSSKI